MRRCSWPLGVMRSGDCPGLLSVSGRRVNLDNSRARAYRARSRWVLVKNIFSLVKSSISSFFLPLSGERSDKD